MYVGVSNLNYYYTKQCKKKKKSKKNVEFSYKICFDYYFSSLKLLYTIYIGNSRYNILLM